MFDFNRTKIIIYVLLGVLILTVLGFFLMRYFSGQSGNTNELFGDNQFPDGNDRDISGDSGFEADRDGGFPGEDDTSAIDPTRPLLQLTDFPIVSPVLDKEGLSILFYKKEGGDLFSSDFDGIEQTQLSNLTIVGLTEALWSPERDRAALFYLDNETLKGFIHKGTSTTFLLPPNVRSFAWSPTGGTGAYLLRDGDALNLTTVDSNGRDEKTIFETPILDAQLSWPTANVLALQTAPSGLAEGILFTYSRTSDRFRQFIGPQNGLISLWSPDGKYVLISSTDAKGKNLSLTVYNDAREEVFKAGLATIPQKCTWTSSEKIYCAAPRNMYDTAVWPDEYLRGKINTSDLIVYIDITEGQIREVFNDESRIFDINNLMATDNESHLFFTNRIDATLWRLKLK